MCWAINMICMCTIIAMTLCCILCRLGQREPGGTRLLMPVTDADKFDMRLEVFLAAKIVRKSPGWQKRYVKQKLSRRISKCVIQLLHALFNTDNAADLRRNWSTTVQGDEQHSDLCMHGLQAPLRHQPGTGQRQRSRPQAAGRCGGVACKPLAARQ